MTDEDTEIDADRKGKSPDGVSCLLYMYIVNIGRLNVFILEYIYFVLIYIE